MWKFKTSKYKNAAPKIPKKEEWITGLPSNHGVQSHGDHIKANRCLAAFNTELAGGRSLGLVALDAKGRQEGRLTVLNAHSDAVTDFDFSGHSDELLATCSKDGSVKIWSIGLESKDVGSPLATVLQGETEVEVTKWHPTAENVLAGATHNCIKVFDVAAVTTVYELGCHDDIVQSFSWSRDGRHMISSCKDKKLRVLDPRTASVVQEASGLTGTKDSRALWLRDTYTLNTGFGAARQREVQLRDTRNFSCSLKSFSLDASPGVLMPFFDVDTNMLFLTAKGDGMVRYMELMEKEPYLSECSVDSVEQVGGAALAPKLALDVTSCEVNRLLLLTQNAIIPLPYIVPRKNVHEFNEDLYPDTCGLTPAMTAAEWCSGENKEIEKWSLNPQKRGSWVLSKAMSYSKQTSDAEANNGTEKDQAAPADEGPISSSKSADKNNDTQQSGSLHGTNSNHQTTAPHLTDNKSQATTPQLIDNQIPNNQKMISPVTKKLTGIATSKFRHFVGSVGPRHLHFENIRNLSHTIPGESNMFHVNPERLALPLAGAGGLILVLEMKSVGRQAESGLPHLQNGAAVTDFQWDPFNHSILAVGCDDAQIKLWQIPQDGLQETLTEPKLKLKGHTEKVYFVRYHPLANNILASAAYDMTVRIWDTYDGEEWLQLEGHTDTIFDLSWSADGVKCATVCKDGQLRVYDPRKSLVPIAETAGPTGSRGARVLWTCADAILVVSGFNKQSCRVVSVYCTQDLNKGLLDSLDIDTSPAILVPYFDEDTSILLLTGRGESTVFAFEVSPLAPHLLPLSTNKWDGLHQALSFLPKSHCNVRQVELMTGFRLTNTTVEPISFKMPRVKMEYFQDDIYKDTRVLWQPALSSTDWLLGNNAEADRMSLQPANMKALSEAPVEAPKAKKYESYCAETYKSDEQKKEELMSAISSKLSHHDEPLPQDLTEGVDDDEWDD